MLAGLNERLLMMQRHRQNPSGQVLCGLMSKIVTSALQCKGENGSVNAQNAYCTTS